MNEDEKLAHYIEIGAVELTGMDEDGEFIFQITPLAETLAPELWESHREHIDRSLIDLYEKGLITVTYNDDLEAIIEITPEGKDAARAMGLIEIEMNDEDIPND